MLIGAAAALAVLIVVERLLIAKHKRRVAAKMAASLDSLHRQLVAMVHRNAPDGAVVTIRSTADAGVSIAIDGRLMAEFPRMSWVDFRLLSDLLIQDGRLQVEVIGTG